METVTVKRKAWIESGGGGGGGGSFSQLWIVSQQFVVHSTWKNKYLKPYCFKSQYLWLQIHFSAILDLLDLLNKELPNSAYHGKTTIKYISVWFVKMFFGLNVASLNQTCIQQYLTVTFYTLNIFQIIKWLLLDVICLLLLFVHYSMKPRSLLALFCNL